MAQGRYGCQGEKAFREDRATQGKAKATTRDGAQKKAENKYIPAIQLIENGASYADAAKAIGISPERLTRWTRRHRPDVHKQAMQNAWITLPGGMRIMRQKWLKMQEAEKAFLGTDESIIEIARRLKLSPTSLLNYLHAMHREDVQRRRDMKGKH